MPTAVKLCGITRPEDARLGVELGAWALGFIFHEPSPRSVEPPAAAEIAAELRRRVELVGVFVDAPLDELAALSEQVGLSILQLHGDEGPAYCREAARRTGARVMKAVRVRDAASVRALGAYQADLHLADAYRADARGGTGETFDWGLLRGRRRDVPLVLSGGLTADNVAAGIAATRPFAVDTASGTEAAPGVKDRERVAAFFRAVAQADATGAESQAPEPARPQPAPAPGALA